MYTFQTKQDEGRSSVSDSITGKADSVPAAVAGARELSDYTAADVEIRDETGKLVATVPAVVYSEE